jgi:hypothetical protein
MKTKRTPKTADQKELDYLWAALDYGVRYREVRFCMTILCEIQMAADRIINERRPADVGCEGSPKPRGRPRKPKPAAEADPGNGHATEVQLPVSIAS